MALPHRTWFRGFEFSRRVTENFVRAQKQSRIAFTADYMDPNLSDGRTIKRKRQLSSLYSIEPRYFERNAVKCRGPKAFLSYTTK